MVDRAYAGGEASNPDLLPALFNPRRRSLLRGSALVLGSFGWAAVLSHFPNNHATLLLIAPAILSILGTVETSRCIQRRWSWYHGGVVLLIYLDLMAVAMILFLLFYPYGLWIARSR